MQGILTLGCKIEMFEINMSMKTDENANHKVYVSQLLEMDEDDEDLINIAMPIYEGKLIPLEVGRRFELYFYVKKGIYACNAEIVQRYKSGNIFILVMRLLSDFKKKQRRQFFRLDTNVELQYKTFTQEDEKVFRTTGRISDEMYARLYEVGMTLDLSGGGARFVSKDKMNKGEKLIIKLVFVMDEEERVIEPLARVINSIPAKGKAGLYENRIEFVHIKDSDRETLIKYIFREERRIRKNQLS